MIKCLIADDEALNRQELTRLLEEEGGFQIVDEAGSGDEAFRKLKSHPEVEVVFLDIDMPGLSGLEVASKLTDWPAPPLVVFATAYHQYAIEAFEANAIDYVLKPYDPARLQKTFERIQEQVKSKSGGKEKLVSLDDELIRKGMIKKLAGHRRNNKDRIVIDPNDVFYFYAHHTEVSAHLDADELIVNATLKEILANLDSQRFAQTHKSYIVNIDKVRKVSPMFSGNFEITLGSKSEEKIPLSRRYARHLKNLLGSW